MSVGGEGVSPLRARTKFRATSFFVVDELPLGTIVTLAIPFGFLSFVAIKKKANTQNQVNVNGFLGINFWVICYPRILISSGILFSLFAWDS